MKHFKVLGWSIEYCRFLVDSHIYVFAYTQNTDYIDIEWKVPNAERKLKIRLIQVCSNASYIIALNFKRHTHFIGKWYRNFFTPMHQQRHRGRAKCPSTSTKCYDSYHHGKCYMTCTPTFSRARAHFILFCSSNRALISTKQTTYIFL